MAFKYLLFSHEDKLVCWSSAQQHGHCWLTRSALAVEVLARCPRNHRYLKITIPGSRAGVVHGSFGKKRIQKKSCLEETFQKGKQTKWLDQITSFFSPFLSEMPIKRTNLGQLQYIFSLKLPGMLKNNNGKLQFWQENNLKKLIQHKTFWVFCRGVVYLN